MLSANSGLYRVAKSDIFNIFNIVIKMNWMYTNYKSETFVNTVHIETFELYIEKYTRNFLVLTESYNIQKHYIFGAVFQCLNRHFQTLAVFLSHWFDVTMCCYAFEYQDC